MAYVLGFFAADGYMCTHKNGGKYIDFYSCDLDIIKKIRKVIGSNHKISKKHYLAETKRRIGVCYRVQIGSTYWYSKLTDLGFYQNKSTSLPYPQIPTAYSSSFVRGYFDGDGNVYIGTTHRKDRPNTSSYIMTTFTSGSKRFIKSLNETLARIHNIHSDRLIFRYGAYRLILSTRGSLKLGSVMYKNDNKLCLLRKKKKFATFMRRTKKRA